MCGSGNPLRETGACSQPCRLLPRRAAMSAEQPQPTCVDLCSDPLACTRMSESSIADVLFPSSLIYLDSTDPDLPQCVCANVTLEILPSDSDCVLAQGTECGEGRVLRAARCLVKDLEVPMDVCRKYRPLSGPNRVHDPVTDGLIYDEQFPGLLRGACTVACARDCATDAWGEWGPCAAEAGSLAAFRFRTREVIEEGSSGGRECGATLQRSTCELAAPRWHAGDWGVCAPRRALCGHALINRTVLCVGANGTPLEESACAGAGPAPPRQAACRAPCPNDCVVSAWSDWSPCEQTKWGGRRDRTRVLLRGANDGGAECPQLVEAEPCAPHLHSWHLAPWDDCQPLGGSPCGEGIKKRAVRCLRSDGVFVNDSFCPNATAMEVRESWCYVPCGVDCVLAEWGPWDASACACGDTSALRHMRRNRQRLVAAVWPGRACGALEQRAPCPREPCMRLVATPLMACRIRTVNGSESELACGWGAEVSEARCRLAGAGGALQPWRCAPALPGRIVSAPMHYQEHVCKVECGCGVDGIAGPWGRWGACRGGARSRTRQLLIPPRTYCRDITRYVTIEWANCTEGVEVPDLLALDDGIEMTKHDWLDKTQYHDGYIEGSGSVLALVWTSTVILCLYGCFMLYRGFLRHFRAAEFRGFLLCLASLLLLQSKHTPHVVLQECIYNVYAYTYTAETHYMPQEQEDEDHYEGVDVRHTKMIMRKLKRR
ncbi:Thrombospondin type-1 domain-containing protein 7A [Eumeta japonica]|uniref:Thrombospondin type-1 domain-containing protein 7A n=1 Tax=Eumeta variegata TaxID=151549 RepID=A0A4C1Y9Y2_EUMVA|nr:Thrombospondin type-1 domain-containing protein 7A [Eumeta japonica]